MIACSNTGSSVCEQNQRKPLSTQLQDAAVDTIQIYKPGTSLHAVGYFDFVFFREEE